MRTDAGYCLAHGLVTLHVRTEAGERCLPAALYGGAVGEAALRRAGSRAQRIARWDQAGWSTWWALLAQVAGGRPAVAAVPAVGQGGEIPFSSAYLVPPTVALRAAGALPVGTALYVGAFAWEVALFGPQGMDEPAGYPSGLEPLYRDVIAAVFRQERRVLLPVQVPAVLEQGVRPDVTRAVEEVVPLLGEGAVVLGGEDRLVVAALAEALAGRGHEVVTVNPLDGLERLVRAVGGLP